MSIGVAFQMDPPECLDLEGDSTFALIEAARACKARLFYYAPQSLSLQEGKVTAPLQPMLFEENNITTGITSSITSNITPKITLGDPVVTDLSTLDVVLMRQDPPFDMTYITATHFLEHLLEKVLVVNHPVSVRNAPEKLLVTHFHNWMPSTLVSGDVAALRRFRRETGDVVMKPLYGNGGEGIFLFRKDDPNFSSYLETVQQGRQTLPVVAQAYIEKVREGDKRIILLDGEVLGAINRLPPAGEIRANMHIGGVAVKTALTEREEEICAALKPILRERGLLFAGIDVIDGLLTEINVTSPTGLRELSRFEGFSAAERVWGVIEEKVAARRGA